MYEHRVSVEQRITIEREKEKNTRRYAERKCKLHFLIQPQAVGIAVLIHIQPERVGEKVKSGRDYKYGGNGCIIYPNPKNISH